MLLRTFELILGNLTPCRLALLKSVIQPYSFLWHSWHHILALLAAFLSRPMFKRVVV